MNLLKRDQPLIAAVRNNKLDDHIKTAAALHWPKDNALTDRLLLKPAINKMGSDRLLDRPRVTGRM
jgi:hypothetical protein